MTRSGRAFAGALGLALALPACADPPGSAGPSESPVTSDSPRASDTAAPIDGALILDPSARPGDRVGELVVRENALRRASGTQVAWVGEVRFEGRIDLHGEIRPHPADPESDAVCFFPEDASARRLPRLAGDERYSWMCFENPEEARGLLPPRSREGVLSVTVEDFLYAFSYSDVHNVARLVSAEPAAIAGCYALELGAWRPARTPGNEVLQTPPSVFALLDSFGDRTFERGQRIARPTIGFQGGSASWRRISADSVRVAWTNGYVGVRLDLGASPRGLEGRATAFTDVVTGQPWPSAPATAVRTECES